MERNLSKIENIKYNQKMFKFAQFLMFGAGISIVCYVVLSSNIAQIAFQDFISSSIIYTLYFMIGILNMISFIFSYYLKKLSSQFSNSTFVFVLFIICLCMFMTFNIITGCVLIYIIYEICKLNKIKLIKTLMSVKREGNLVALFSFLTIYVFMIITIYLTLFKML